MTLAQPLFQGSILTKPLGPNRVVINDANNYAQKLANQATRTKATSPAGWYDLGYQTIAMDYTYAVPVYWVPQGAPTYPVTWYTATAVPASMTQSAGLQTYVQHVPVPVERGDALPAAGTDRSVVIIEEGTGRCWEFWDFTFDPVKLTGGCSFGAYIPNVFRHPGILPWGWGVSASGIALAALMNRMAEYRDGVFAHPLRLQVPDTTGTHIFPAVRNDGGGAKAANVQGSAVDQVPEGLWVALPANYVVPTTGLSQFQQMVQTQVRDYGAIVCDATGGSVNIILEDHHTQGTGYCEVPDLVGVVYPQPGFWDLIHAADGAATNPWNNFPWALLQQVAPPQ